MWRLNERVLTTRVMGWPLGLASEHPGLGLVCPITHPAWASNPLVRAEAEAHIVAGNENVNRETDMRRTAWILAGLAVLAGAIIALLPLRLALRGTGIVADEVSGSIWRGHITSASWHGIALGDLDTSARAWPPALDFSGPVMRGRVTPAGLEGLSGNIDDFAGLPLTQIAIDNVTVLADERGCTYAGGEVAVVATPLPQLGALSGPLACDNGVLRAALRPEHGDALVNLSLDKDRRYRAVLTIGSLPAMVRVVMIAAGFEATEAGVAMTREGRL